MTLKALVHHHPVRVTQYFERVDAQSRAGKNQIRVDGRPWFRQITKVDTRVFQVEESIRRDNSRIGIGNRVGRPQFLDHIG